MEAGCVRRKRPRSILEESQEVEQSRAHVGVEAASGCVFTCLAAVQTPTARVRTATSADLQQDLHQPEKKLTSGSRNNRKRNGETSK